MSERRHPNVVNIDEIDPQSQSNGKFALEHRALGGAAGARGLGAGMITLAPGKTAWPHHYHCANEESIYVLSGTGTARIGDAKVEIRAGDYLAFPPGPAHAHQTTNTGTEPLVYLCFSTMITTEAVGYPDSKKLAMSSWTRGEDGSRTSILRAVFREEDQVDYWDREVEK